MRDQREGEKQKEISIYLSQFGLEVLHIVVPEDVLGHAAVTDALEKYQDC